MNRPIPNRASRLAARGSKPARPPRQARHRKAQGRSPFPWHRPWFALLAGLLLAAALSPPTNSLAKEPAATAPNNPPRHQALCTVIMQTRADRLYCYATNQPFRVILRDPQRFAHGEVFLAEGQLIASGMAEAIPTLLDSTVQRLSQTNLPPARRVTALELEDDRLNFHRVILRGRVLAHEALSFLDKPMEGILAENEDHSFRVNVLNPSDARNRLPVGSVVDFVGLSFMERYDDARGMQVQIDVENLDECILRPATPWMTFELTRRNLSFAVTAVVLGSLWFIRERRQITRLLAAERDIRQLNGELEHRIAARTTELSDANVRLRDEVDARKRAEAGLRLALATEKELNELKSRFVSTVSHEFRTPLAIIMSSAEILEAYHDRLSTNQRTANLHDIVEATRHMGSMVDDVLLLARLESGKSACNPIPLDLADFCQRLVDEVASATHRRCPTRLRVNPSLPQAWADEGLLRHVLTNLLANAVKYSAPGQSVDLLVETSGPDALFTVRDQGIGIPEADARQLFTAFHRGSNVGDTPGSGLGLLIARSCAELHGGTISFESRVGQGTSFFVSLPLLRPPAPPHPVPALPRQPAESAPPA